MTNKKNVPHEKKPQSTDINCALGEFPADENFYLEYGENLAAQDLRPIVFKNYTEGEK